MGQAGISQAPADLSFPHAMARKCQRSEDRSNGFLERRAWRPTKQAKRCKDYGTLSGLSMPPRYLDVPVQVHSTWLVGLFSPPTTVL